MPGVTINCPQCQQKIINASPGGDGYFHCSGCGNRFGNPAENSGSVLVSNTSSEPPGRPPEQTSYGLLSVAMWLLFIYLLASNGFEFWNMGPGDPLYKPSYILRAGSHVLMSLLGILTVTVFTRLDTCAAWIAWRCGALSEPVGDPPGGSLRYILPLAVFGGITVIFASEGITDQRLNNDGDMIRIGTATAGGIALLLAGLACGEIRRFFWRMSTIGAALRHLPRGADLGLNASPEIAAVPISRSSSRFNWMAVSLIVFLLWTHAKMIGNKWTSGAHSVYFVAGLLAFLISIKQLIPLFGEMIKRWTSSGVSIATAGSHRNSAGQRKLLYIVAASACLAIVVVHLASLIITSMKGRGIEFSPYGYLILSPIANLFINLWLIELCHDCGAFADACARFSKDRASPPTTLTWMTRILCVTAILFTCATFGSQCYDLWSMKAAFRTMGSAWWYYIPQAVIGNTGHVFLTLTLPAIVWSMIALHMQRAAVALERCVEVKKKPEVSAEPHAVQL